MLQAYIYEIEYRKSEDHGNVDALLRLLSAVERTADECRKLTLLTLQRKYVEIQCCVLEYVLTGQPNHVHKNKSVLDKAM